MKIASPFDALVALGTEVYELPGDSVALSAQGARDLVALVEHLREEAVKANHLLAGESFGSNAAAFQEHAEWLRLLTANDVKPGDV